MNCLQFSIKYKLRHPESTIGYTHPFSNSIRHLKILTIIKYLYYLYKNKELNRLLGHFYVIQGNLVIDCASGKIRRCPFETSQELFDTVEEQ